MSNPTITFDSELKKLTIRNAREFPDAMYEYTEDVETLDMTYGSLTTIPEDIGRFKKLKIAFFSYNEFETIPESLTQCTNLELVGFKSCKITTIPDNPFPDSIRGIILTDNKITKLPASIGKYTQLQKLMLTGNHLQKLPEEILQCQNLALLRLSVNHLLTFPIWLTTLPKLSWYADAGNPYHEKEMHYKSTTQMIDWNELQIKEKIGESASNMVYKALYKNKAVAVKLYGAALSTDGRADDDMYACLIAGTHENIIGAIGQLKNTPDNKPGLVMPLIANNYKKLGNPPDFSTFTRDVFTDSQRYEIPVIMQIAQDVAKALAHCHKMGIMHGDLYAHNILTNEHGESYVGDFGAASLYTPNTKEGLLREKLDVRAYGCLLEDLMKSRVDNEDNLISRKLEQAEKKCLDQEIEKVPTFEHIYRDLLD